MGPKPTLPSSGGLYRSRLDKILDHRHELFRLAGLINWDHFDQEFGRFYRPLGRPAKPTRLMVGLSYLQHTVNPSFLQFFRGLLRKPGTSQMWGFFLSF
jgi:IS5 family transposase